MLVNVHVHIHIVLLMLKQFAILQFGIDLFDIHSCCHIFAVCVLLGAFVYFGMARVI